MSMSEAISWIGQSTPYMCIRQWRQFNINVGAQECHRYFLTSIIYICNAYHITDEWESLHLFREENSQEIIFLVERNRF